MSLLSGNFKKAFDCVNHQILLSKFHHYGLRGISFGWFKYYLENRKQYVSINERNSDTLLINCGVPQGSILGPLIFLIFPNDLPSSTTYFKFILFADDSTLSPVINPLINSRITARLINWELLNVYKRLISNKICINASKTKYIIFTYNKKLNLPLIKLGKHKIKETNNTKCLGVYFDENLKFAYHIKYISGKISESVGVLYRLIFFASFYFKNNISNFYSSLLYIWY